MPFEPLPQTPPSTMNQPRLLLLLLFACSLSFSATAQSQTAATDFARRAVSTLDRDGDGLLTVYELPRIMQSGFTRLDNNQDRLIDASERGASFWSALSRFDQDGDRTLSEEEEQRLRDSLPQERMLTTKRLLKAWDRDESNTLTLDELPKVIGRDRFRRLDDNSSWVLTVNELVDVWAELDDHGALKKLYISGSRIPLSESDRLELARQKADLIEAMKRRRQAEMR